VNYLSEPLLRHINKVKSEEINCGRSAAEIQNGQKYFMPTFTMLCWFLLSQTRFGDETSISFL
jgi:hypothetical protein